MLAQTVGLDVRLLTIAADLAIGPISTGAVEVARILALRPAILSPGALALDAPTKSPVVEATPIAATTRMRAPWQTPAYVQATKVGTAVYVPTVAPARPVPLLQVPAIHPRLVPRPIAPPSLTVVRQAPIFPTVNLTP